MSCLKIQIFVRQEFVRLLCKKVVQVGKFRFVPVYIQIFNEIHSDSVSDHSGRSVYVCWMNLYNFRECLEVLKLMDCFCVPCSGKIFVLAMETPFTCLSLADWEQNAAFEFNTQ